jgi:hypothetical protein
MTDPIKQYEEWKEALLKNARLKIVLQDLGRALMGTHPFCLDLTTGAVVPAAGCPQEETGEGRPALQQGKRFLRLPALDEAFLEFVERGEQAEGEAERKFLNKDYPKGTSDDWSAWCAAVRDEIKATCPPEEWHDLIAVCRRLRNEAQDLVEEREKIRGWFRFLREEESAQKLALRWVACLRPEFPVLMVDECDDEPLFQFDPKSGRWVEV